MDNNKVADSTLTVLEDLYKLISHVRGNQPQSLGVIPAFYFYTSKGQYRQALFFLFLMWISYGNSQEIKERKFRFTLVRDLYEETWLITKHYLFRSLGRKGIGPNRLTKTHIKIMDSFLEHVEEGKTLKNSSLTIAEKFLRGLDPKVFKEFELDFNINDNGVPYKPFSNGTKIEQEMNAFFEGTYRCELCNGAIDLGISHQVDHRVKRSEGGTNDSTNARIVHPWCNNNRDKIENSINSKPKKEVLQNKKLPKQKPEPDLTSYKGEQLSLF